MQWTTCCIRHLLEDSPIRHTRVGLELNLLFTIEMNRIKDIASRPIEEELSAFASNSGTTTKPIVYEPHNSEWRNWVVHIWRTGPQRLSWMPFPYKSYATIDLMRFHLNGITVPLYSLHTRYSLCQHWNAGVYSMYPDGHSTRFCRRHTLRQTHRPF